MRSLFKSMYAYSAYLKNHYQTLGILSTASDEEIKAAYYKLAKANHPDITPENSNKFKEIGEAYNVLKDPLKVRLTVNRGESLTSPSILQNPMLII
jgi:DnaJ-class molecular chaperone